MCCFRPSIGWKCPPRARAKVQAVRWVFACPVWRLRPIRATIRKLLRIFTSALACRGAGTWTIPIQPWKKFSTIPWRKVGPTWKGLVEEFQQNGWWDVKKLRPDDWGTYYRFQTGFLKKSMTEDPTPSNVIPGFNTPTMKQEIWCTIMETYHGAEDALPDYRPHPDTIDKNPDLWKEYPVQCLTGRRIPVYFHSEHRQLPWCREVWPTPRVEMNPEDAAEWGIEQGDWVLDRKPSGQDSPNGRSLTSAFRRELSTPSICGGIRKCPRPSTAGVSRL